MVSSPSLASTPPHPHTAELSEDLPLSLPVTKCLLVTPQLPQVRATLNPGKGDWSQADIVCEGTKSNIVLKMTVDFRHFKLGSRRRGWKDGTGV